MRRSQKKDLIFLFALFCGWSAWARAQSGSDASVDAGTSADAGVEVVDGSGADAKPSDADAGASVEAPPMGEVDGGVSAVPASPPIAVETSQDHEGRYRLDEAVVTYEGEEESEPVDTVQRLDEKNLKALKQDDPQRILTRTPGVYVRTEDGWGLRPNIGIRGVSSDRSSKITLMEDGILFGPAPYSAPAAYYFPLMQRMVGIDVTKGPSVLQYGPQLVGGAINWLSRPVPEVGAGEVDVAYGLYRSRREHLHYGASNSWGGFLIEGVDLGTEGFKDVDHSDQDTGFVRQEAIARGFLRTDPDRRVRNRFDLRLGYSRERSYETYLGLTDEDFREHSNRRYIASSLDRMKWNRYEARVTHTLEIGEQFKLETALYHHRFHRIWRRFNGFRGGPSIEDVLQDPKTGINAVYYSVLTGAESSSSADEELSIFNNNRKFVSEGVQSNAEIGFKTGPVEHRIAAGARLHYDSIRRDHTDTPYAVENATLVRSNEEVRVAADNTATSLAFSAHAEWMLKYRNFSLAPIVRTEVIHSKIHDRLLMQNGSVTYAALLPGVSAHAQVYGPWSVLAGVYRGFGPRSPGTKSKAEDSINYQVGGRFAEPRWPLSSEVLFFVNDYSNLTGQCADFVGCADQQFSAGSVLVYGLESVADYTYRATPKIEFPMRLTYTLTWSEFRSSFMSDNPLWGNVQKGDELPYVPRHQLAVEVGAAGKRWNARAIGVYTGKMRSEASKGNPGPGGFTDAYFMLDATGEYQVFPHGFAYVRFENLLNSQPIASRQPFGARPLKPFLALVGFRYEL